MDIIERAQLAIGIGNDAADGQRIGLGIGVDGVLFRIIGTARAN
jgi:hypothetical protein